MGHVGHALVLGRVLGDRPSHATREGDVVVPVVVTQTRLAPVFRPVLVDGRPPATSPCPPRLALTRPQVVVAADAPFVKVAKSPSRTSQVGVGGRAVADPRHLLLAARPTPETGGPLQDEARPRLVDLLAVPVVRPACVARDVGLIDGRTGQVAVLTVPAVAVSRPKADRRVDL